MSMWLQRLLLPVSPNPVICSHIHIVPYTAHLVLVIPAGVIGILVYGLLIVFIVLVHLNFNKGLKDKG